ncbi:MAG: hypothetical protein IPK19_17655 [Chloroflexi bacterium]|nr:hypothetical protein [Chloroflexota bacterium]
MSTQRRPQERLCLIVLALCAFAIVSGVSAQDADSIPLITFTPYEENPVVDRESGSEWGCESGTIFAPQVIEVEGVLYMFYSGSCERTGKPAAIGYATSTDGVQWEKAAENPILAPDGDGYDARCVSIGVPMYEDGQWILYYAANSTPCNGPGKSIGRATAPSPDGPWVREADAVLTAGDSSAWDNGFLMPHAVFHIGDQYIMYYSGGAEFLLPLPRLVGMATSTDGIHWAKYDDPATTEAPYAESDPLMELNADGTTSEFSAWSLDIGKTEQGWEMFFSSPCPESVSQNCVTFMGYAVSDDGLNWRAFRSLDTAVLTLQQVAADWAASCICHPTYVAEGSDYRLYFVGCTEEMNDCRIGMATGSITWPGP